MAHWTITIAAPTGEFEATLDIAEGAGVMTGATGSGPMEGLSLSDSAMSWSTKIEKPMPMTLKFDGTIEGDAISGKVKFGMFASGTFTGERVAQEV